MPDGPRERFMPKVRLEALPVHEPGFTPRNTSGLNAAELAALNAVLSRMIARGLTERQAKVALHGAVAAGLEPIDADKTDLERLLAWR